MLRGCRSSGKKDPKKLNGSRAKVRHREAEQGRRTAIRSLQEQISRFFLVKGQRKVSIGELLLFGKSIGSTFKPMAHLPNYLVVIYLRIGEVAFPGLIHPRTHNHEQQE